MTAHPDARVHPRRAPEERRPLKRSCGCSGPRSEGAMSAKRSTKTVTAGNDIQELGDIERAANSARQCFEGILRWALSPEARSRDLHEVERETFAKLLELGRSVLEAHL